MEIRVIDFERLTAHYKNYREGIDEINQERKKILELVEPIRKEMNRIIASSTNGLIIDGKTQEQQAKKFQELQQELVSIDNDYKVKNKQMVDKLNVKTFDELSIIVEDWAELNSIDVVSGKMEIIFCNDKYDVTDDIIENDKAGDVEKNLDEITGEAENESEVELQKKMTDVIKTKPELVKKILNFTNFISDEKNKDKVAKIDQILGA